MATVAVVHTGSMLARLASGAHAARGRSLGDGERAGAAARGEVAAAFSRLDVASWILPSSFGLYGPCRASDIAAVSQKTPAFAPPPKPTPYLLRRTTGDRELADAARVEWPIDCWWPGLSG